MPLILNGDTGISGVDGTAGTPSLQGTDSNTGVFYATDIVGISTNGSERMRINSSGDVGIGTGSPSTRLTISSTYTSARGQLSVVSTDTDVGQTFYVGSTFHGVLAFNSSLGYVGTSSNTPLAFITNNAERMRIDSSGRVGIGVTPSPWSNFTVLQISSIGALVANDFGSANTQVRLTSNTYWDGANFRYVTSNPAAMYSINGREHIWSSIASGTAGNSISFVESLRINPNGNLVLQGGTTTANGIGITFPATQSASSDANTLDDYEEGTWTPAFASSSGSATYTAQTGNYVKIGRQVTATFYLQVNVSSSLISTGDISGLPFAASNSNYAGAALSAYNGGIFNGYGNILLLAGGGATTLQIRITSSATQAPSTSFAGNTVTNGTLIAGTVTYFTS